MFVAVVEEGGYFQAGQRLHVAHSAVHRQVRLLEEETGERLLYRSGRRMNLTESGRQIHQLACRVLNDVSNVTLRLRESRELHSGRVHLGTGTSMLLTFLPRVLELFRSRYPQVDVQVMTGTATEVLGAITSGTLDLGVVFTTPEPALDTTGLDLSSLYDERFVLIVPPDSRLSNRKRVSALELAGTAMITFSPLSRIRQFIDSQLNAGAVRVKVVMELENEEAIERMVAIGVGSAFITRGRAVTEGLAFLEVEGIDLRVTVSVATSARIPMTNAAREFRATCVECAENESQHRAAAAHRAN
jgi:LysR family transcriptional regulator, transcription activator of glutamate synthase operon